MDKEFTIRTDCEAIVKFIQGDQEKRRSVSRGAKFQDTLVNGGYKPKFEHLTGKDNYLADYSSQNLFSGQGSSSNKQNVE